MVSAFFVLELLHASIKDLSLPEKSSSRYDFDSGNYNKARNLFKEILSIDNNSDGAEAMYNLIYLTFLDDSLDLAEKLIFEMPDQFSDDFYIAKSFILLSDIYLKKENKFQAKATLESIIVIMMEMIWK